MTPRPIAARPHGLVADADRRQRLAACEAALGIAAERRCRRPGSILDDAERQARDGVLRGSVGRARQRRYREYGARKPADSINGSTSSIHCRPSPR